MAKNYTLYELELLFDLKNYAQLKREICELEKEVKQCPLNTLIDRRNALCRRVEEVERRLAACPMERRRVLYARFSEGKSWSKIATEAGYTREYISGKYLRTSFRRYLAV